MIREQWLEAIERSHQPRDPRLKAQPPGNRKARQLKARKMLKHLVATHKSKAAES